jgi:hypothetical protein
VLWIATCCRADDSLELLPQDMDWVLGADVEKIVATSAFANWEAGVQGAQPQRDLVEFLHRSGLDLRRDVKRLLVGAQAGRASEFVALLEGNFDPATLLPRRELTEHRVGGLTFYRPAPEVPQSPALAGQEFEFAFLDPHRLVLCSSGAAGAVAATAASGGPSLAQDSEMQALIGEVRGRAMIWMVGRLRPDAEGVLAGNPFAAGLRNVRSASFTMDFGDGLRSDLLLRCDDEVQAGRVFETVSALVAIGRGLVGAQNPAAARALEGLRADRKGAAVSLSLVLDREAINALGESFKRPAAHSASPP